MATDQIILGPQVIRAAAARIRAAIEVRRGQRLEAVRRTGNALRGLFDARGQEVRTQLEAWVHKYKPVGCPPSFVVVAGLSDYEKPFNRLLAWWADPNAEHGAGREFLRLLACRLGFHALEKDLYSEEKIKVCSEEPVPESGSSREPDLFVLTQNAALLLENKVWAPESGDGQYEEYLGILHRAAQKRECRAILCSRDDRRKPEGWDDVLRHDELAKVFRDLARSPEVPAWGKISATLCAVAFEENKDWENLCEAQELLSGTQGAVIRVHQARRMKELCDMMKQPCVPW
jgi:hypothetical protein